MCASGRQHPPAEARFGHTLRRFGHTLRAYWLFGMEGSSRAVLGRLDNVAARVDLGADSTEHGSYGGTEKGGIGPRPLPKDRDISRRSRRSRRPAVQLRACRPSPREERVAAPLRLSLIHI